LLAGIVLFQRVAGHSRSAETFVLLAVCAAIGFRNQSSFALYCPLIAVIILYVDPAWWRAAPIRFFGAISYSLYLVHDGAGAWVRGAIGGWTGLDARLVFCLAVLASIVMATIFYLLIERPALRLSRRVAYRARRPASPSPIRP
jgi:peptidoglycan/LPS O-acetylase OafA/YrhL